jgi:phospho-2-dehydro-3-deoxyheptonate aldolase
VASTWLARMQLHYADRSQKDLARQVDVIESIVQQIRNGNHSIIGFMIESNLEWGTQPISHNPKELRYGISITDPCIDWETTERAVRGLREQLLDVLTDRPCPRDFNGCHETTPMKGEATRWTSGL